MSILLFVVNLYRSFGCHSLCGYFKSVVVLFFCFAVFLCPYVTTLASFTNQTRSKRNRHAKPFRTLSQVTQSITSRPQPSLICPKYVLTRIVISISVYHLTFWWSIAQGNIFVVRKILSIFISAILYNKVIPISMSKSFIYPGNIMIIPNLTPPS